MPAEGHADASAQIARAQSDALGEGTSWSTSDQELVWVDITAGLVHRWNPARGDHRRVSIGREISAAVPCRGGETLIAAGHDLLMLDDEELGDVLAQVELDHHENRFNDCRCDPQGRLWAGTMSRTRKAGAAALYRLEAGGEIELMIDKTTISNGLGWSPDGERMYFIDSTTQRVDVLDFDGRDGSISNRRALLAIEPSMGLPDGLAIDAEGGLWVALFGGSAIHRYSPEGELTEVVPLPVTNPTCPGFGGRELTTLYVTSARHTLSSKQLALEPHAGALLALETGVRGLAPTPFAN